MSDPAEKSAADPLRVIVVTGLSGAGKSTALRVLEDLGYFCVDNLPAPLVLEFVRMAETRADIGRVALGIDARGHAFGQGADVLPQQLAKAGYNVSILFLECSDGVLVRRFSESRRPHPLGEGLDVLSGVQAEREALSKLRAQAHDVLDTSLLSVHQLRRQLTALLGPEGGGHSMAVRMMSFGFRYGLPADADLVFDVRFLPNPYFEPTLKRLSGLETKVSSFVLGKDEAQNFLGRCEDLLQYLIPLYRREGKSYLTIALGCTGGRHRSVALAEELASRLELGDPVPVLHRDVNRHQGERRASWEVTL